MGEVLEGRCSCGEVRYRMLKNPLFVHACHCTWCQRETGTAFALNAMIEAEFLEYEGAVEEVETPSASSKGQVICRCPKCKVAVWSYYAGMGRLVAFLRVGTLEEPSACPPDIHIFTSTKQEWLKLDDRVPVVPGWYDRKQYWPAESLERRKVMLEKAKG